jgi:glycerol uptake facilitator-like aquaporin
MLVPLALAAGKRWRAFAAAAASVADWIGLSVLLFGWGTWYAYFASFFGSRGLSQFELEHFNPAGFISLFSAARLAGAPVGLAQGIQLMGTLTAAGLVAWIWWRNCSLALRAAVLAAGTLAAAPFAVLYDLMVATVAMAWLVRAGRQAGFLPGEIPVIAGIYLVPLLALQMGNALHIPLGPLPGLGVLALCVARAFHEAVDAAPQPVGQVPPV